MAAPPPKTAYAPFILKLFGPMRGLVAGEPLPRLHSRKAQWLLALLALRGGRPVEREWLAGTLWPDADQDQAFANLRPVLSDLRRALGDQAERLQSPNRHTLCLEITGADVDVLEFDRAIAAKTLPALERAVAHYTGPLLEGCAEEWAPQERRARDEECARALLTLADAALANSDYDAAAGHYRRACDVDPWRDTARRGLMEALGRSGDVNAALQVYREFAALLRTDPKAIPDPETSALYASLRGQARSQAAPAAAAPVIQDVAPRVAGYLPHALTELIGREDDCRQVAAKLLRSRLVTLTGPGGIGKTRLAIEVATEAAPEFLDGTWLVALETLSDGAQAARQIAVVLGLKEEAGRAVLQTLIEHLRSKQLLLVLDNCEHLLEAIADIASNLLRECANLRILATSREALSITGEAAWSVPALAAPNPADLPSPQTSLVTVLMEYESVQLFVERAQAAQNSFVLSEVNAPAVAEICASLDGLPLAIELAAARIRAMTVAQIAARLDDHLSLLTGGSRTGSSRQQTLRSTLDWSYSLLGEPERLLLERLSVFRGGCSLEAAEAVCAGDAMRAGQILDLLTSLTDKSLVMFRERQSEGRYYLLDIVRQYAAERLDAGESPDKVHVRHRDYYLAFAEEGEMQLKGAGQGLWLRRLEVERDNLRVALVWCSAENEGAIAGLRLAGALRRFWELRGHYSEGRSYLSEALERDGARGRTGERAKALNTAGVLASYQGDYISATALHEESLGISRETDDRQGIGWSLHDLGKVAFDRGDYQAAKVLHEGSLAISRETGNRQGAAWSLNDLGKVAYGQHDFATAKTLYQESLAISREMADEQGVGWSLYHLASVAAALKDYADAITLYEESLAISRETGNRQGTAWGLHDLAKVFFAQGDYTEAEALHEEALSMFRELGNKIGIAWSLSFLGSVFDAQGDRATAAALRNEGMTIFEEMGNKLGIAWLLEQS